MDLFDELAASGQKLDNHESDLYVLQTEISLAIVQKLALLSYSTFVSRIDGKIWIEVPFAYSPWWRARTG